MNSPAAVEQFSLTDWLAWMESHHPRQIELGLDRIREVADRLGLLRAIQADGVRVITVGGTNGKGSCVAFLEGMLRAHGHRVGAYTSPHLLAYNERVRIDGQTVSDGELCAAFCAVHAALGAVSLTYFEFGTLAALWLFSRQPLAVWVLEVGLGGRLDAVNIIDADVAVLTTIDLDHQDWLGDDRETIGREKAGIFRKDCWAICVDPQPPQSVLRVAAEVEAKWLIPGDDLIITIDESSWSWSAPALSQSVAFRNLPLPHLPLPSAVAALTALQALQVPLVESSVAAALRNTSLLARFQQIELNGVEVVLDVAHNPQAARWLAQRLRQAPVKRTLAVFEIMQDKDLEGVVEALDAQVDVWFLGGLADNPRAADPADVAQLLSRRGISAQLTHTTVAEAFSAAINIAGAGDRVLVFGSFFTVAAALQLLAAFTGEQGEPLNA